MFYHEVSTSPVGLFAKSVIDLDVIIEDRGKFEAVKQSSDEPKRVLRVPFLMESYKKLLRRGGMNPGGSYFFSLELA